jgi:hypothetical protein
MAQSVVDHRCCRSALLLLPELVEWKLPGQQPLGGGVQSAVLGGWV